MRTSLSPFCAALAAAFLLAGCGAASTPHVPAGLRPDDQVMRGEDQLPVLGQLDMLSGLPCFSELDSLASAHSRQASADNIQDGSAFFKSSPGAVVSGSELILNASNKFEWAIYSYDPAGAPLLQVSVDPTVTSGSYYLPLPDHVTGRWFLSLPLTSAIGSSLGYPGATSAAGLAYCAVIVPAGNSSTVITVNFVTDDTPPLEPIDAVSEGFSGWYANIEMVEGRPAIAYCEFESSDPVLGQENGTLMYVRANDALGAAWGAPMEIDTNGDTGYTPDLLVVNGQPAIAYHKFDDEILMYVRATDTTGSAWGTPLEVDSTGNVGGFPHMELVNAAPAIVHLHWPSGGGADLKYVRASDANGASWGSPVSIAALSADPGDEDFSDDWSLAVVNGRPAVAYADENIGPLSYIRASDADGALWSEAAVQVASDTVQWNDLMVLGDGTPCISFYNRSSGELQFARASDNNGSAWGSAVTVDNRSDPGYFSDMILFNDKPVIAYYSALSGDLGIAFADDSAGSAWSDLRTLDATGNTGGFPSILPLSNGTLGISYLDADTDDLRYVGGVQ